MCCIISVTTTHTQFQYLVSCVLALDKLFPSLKYAVADPLPKHLTFGLWSSPVQPLLGFSQQLLGLLHGESQLYRSHT